MTRHPPAVERMVANATALVQTIAVADFTTGFVVISAPLPGRIGGLAVGPGVQLAAAHGHTGGVGSVWVDPVKWTGGADTPPPDIVATYAAVVLHEVAHAVTTREAVDADDAMRAVDRTAHELNLSAELAARWHCNRWVAAYAVLLKRAVRARAELDIGMCHYIAGDVARWGFNLADVVEAVEDFRPTGPLRDALAVDGEWAGRLAERLPPLDARLAAIVEAGTPRPEGERGIS